MNAKKPKQINEAIYYDTYYQIIRYGKITSKDY